MEPWETEAADGNPLPLYCTGGPERHARRVLGRFQHYLGRDGEDRGWSEIYQNGLTPPADQYLLQDETGTWFEVGEPEARAAIVSHVPVRNRWSRECPKCGRHYVFDSDALQARIVEVARHGLRSLDLSHIGV